MTQTDNKVGPVFNKIGLYFVSAVVILTICVNLIG